MNKATKTVCVSDWEKGKRERVKEDKDFQGNLIAVIQIHHKESMLPLFSGNGGALICLCEGALFSSLQCGGNLNLNSK